MFCHAHSVSMVHLWKPELSSVLKPGSSAVVESAKFILELTVEQVSQFSVKVGSVHVPSHHSLQATEIAHAAHFRFCCFLFEFVKLDRPDPSGDDSFLNFRKM